MHVLNCIPAQGRHCERFFLRGSHPSLKSGQTRRRLRLLSSLALAFALGAASGAVAQAGAAGEQEIKAAFLFNFAKFVDWPPGTFNHPDDPLWYCIWGDESYGRVLMQTVKGKIVDGHPLQVRLVHAPQDVKGCHILFVTAAHDLQAAQFVHTPVAGLLTVGEEEDFARFGGIINFVLQDEHIGFEINIDASQRAGMKISSKLLSLARIVHDDPAARRG